MGPQQCQVCKDALSKYKCPTCFLPYCSLHCYKKHKETPCMKLEPPAEADAPQTQPPRGFEETEDGQRWRLQQNQLKSIAASDDIRGMLKDPELQNLIRKIDDSLQVEQDLSEAMKGQLFQEFTDKILAIVNREEQALKNNLDPLQ